jgi:two-component system, chemotaxis family, protein-glutamate methylesterase/glutaminase
MSAKQETIPVARDRKIRVLVVDDSALVQKLLTKALSECDDIEVVGCAGDPYAARDKIMQLRPDVLTLDIEMPRMDGLTFLGKLMAFRPLPVVVVSSLTAGSGDVALRAMELGAVEVVPKPGSQFSVPEVKHHLAGAIRAASRAVLRPPTHSFAPPRAARATRPALATTDKMIVIGASTGGTKAVEVMLREFPAASPGVLVVQHMPTGFTAPFAARLDAVCAMTVREARDGDAVSAGLVLVAPAGHHMRLARSGGHYVVRLDQGPPVQFQRPSIDVLFHSVAEEAGANATGVILTGMGQDGAQGLLAMRRTGALTVAEDASTCVVYGMPRAAFELGAADVVLPLPRIAGRVLARAPR